MAGVSNLAAFKRIAAAALLAGVLAGVLLTAVQRLQIIPILLQAEVYEDAASTHAPAATESTHHHDADAWKPQNGWERTFYTAVANVSLALGFALLLSAAMAVRGGANGWRNGLLWGLAGYTIFFIAPALGLPPEVPGAEAAPLADRQLWWLMAVVGTSAGLALVVFARSTLMKTVGIALLVAPHLIGAPQPAIHASAAPLELAHAFIYASAMANAVLWLALGALTGFFYQKMA
jgi:cobalt transporter subunit CbtA